MIAYRLYTQKHILLGLKYFLLPNIDKNNASSVLETNFMLLKITLNHTRNTHADIFNGFHAHLEMKRMHYFMKCESVCFT